jgi:hypothetical protein
MSRNAAQTAEDNRRYAERQEWQAAKDEQQQQERDRVVALLWPNGEAGGTRQTR